MIDNLENFLFPVGLFILAVYFYKVWKKPLASDASIWEIKTHIIYLFNSIGAFITGIACLIFSIVHACTGWIAK